jgi:deazaflavin-dependent oxidoreductase (nitroreductase family)
MTEKQDDSSGNYYTSAGQLDKLPDEVQRELQMHLEMYLHDPEKAHIWDPIVIGVPGGPVKTLLLTAIGRKSGKKINNVLQYYKLDGAIAVVASRGGTIEHPSWYLNLLADPRCVVRIGLAVSQARIRTLEGEERERWWKSITAEQPAQLTYQARCPRVIPIAVLEFEHPDEILAASV